MVGMPWVAPAGLGKGKKSLGKGQEALEKAKEALENVLGLWKRPK